MSDSIRGDNGERLAVELDCKSDFPLDGRLVYTVHPSRPGSFGINFRVPGWASGFSATVNGKAVEQGAGGLSGAGVETGSGSGAEPGARGVLGIHRGWVDGDSIVITMQLPLMRLAGGLSFPGRVAFKRGPQVLAEDSVLTAIIGSRADRPGRNTLPARDTAGLSDLSGLLPKSWSGKQAYGIGGFVLTPFADAGQLDGPITIWLDDKAIAR
jgi:DUF1680 family protein